MQALIQKLGVAVLRRNPSLGEKFQPGLPIGKIKNDLKRAGVEGEIEPIVELYSWKNGTTLQDSDALRAGFVPPMVYELSEIEKQVSLNNTGLKRDTESRAYHFTELKRALVDMKSFKEFARYHPRLSVLVGRYFPFLWDGSGSWIALDIEPSGGGRVVVIQTGEVRDVQPLREAYDSFEEFLKDAVRANENNEPLACMRAPGKPITETAESHPASAVKAVAPKRSASKRIPATENPLVLRTDFSDEPAWKSLCKALQNPDDEFSPSLDFVSDPTFDGLAAAKLPSLLSEDSSHTFAFIVDRTALTRSANPVLVIDLHDKPGRTFRVTAAALGEVANNLSIANMDFDEFAKAVDKEGVFRGFGSARTT